MEYVGHILMLCCLAAGTENVAVIETAVVLVDGTYMR